jgi:hypothetical protein
VIRKEKRKRRVQGLRVSECSNNGKGGAMLRTLFSFVPDQYRVASNILLPTFGSIKVAAW